ncbi:hypothetical protein ScPMuIL_016648 [Solemya velum]
MSTDYHTAQGDFTSIVYRLQPMVLSNFVMWLDLKVAEFKVYGQMLLDAENDDNTPSWFLRSGALHDIQSTAKRKERSSINSARPEITKRTATSTITRPNTKQPRIDISDDDEIIELKSKPGLPHDPSGMMDNLSELQDQLDSFFKASGSVSSKISAVQTRADPSQTEAVHRKVTSTSTNIIPNQKNVKQENVSTSSKIPQNPSISQNSVDPSVPTVQNIEKTGISSLSQVQQSWTVESSPTDSSLLEHSETSNAKVVPSHVHEQSSSSPTHSIQSSHPSKKHTSAHSSGTSESNVVVKREPVDQDFEIIECEEKFVPRIPTSATVSNSEQSLMPESDMSLEASETLTKSDGSMYFVSPEDQEGQIDEDRTDTLGGIESVSRRSTEVVRVFNNPHGSNNPRTYIVTPSQHAYACSITEGGHGIPHNMDRKAAGRTQKGFLPKMYASDHDDDQGVLCPICTLQLASQSELDEHLLKHIDLQTKTCYVCGKKLACRSSLVNHLKRHAGHRNYECPICQKSFVSKYQYDGHMAGHDPARKLACSNCGKTFAFGSNLRRHERVCFVNNKHHI